MRVDAAARMLRWEVALWRVTAVVNTLCLVFGDEPLKWEQDTGFRWMLKCCVRNDCENLFENINASFIAVGIEHFGGIANCAGTPILTSMII